MFLGKILFSHIHAISWVSIQFVPQFKIQKFIYKMIGIKKKKLSPKGFEYIASPLCLLKKTKKKRVANQQNIKKISRYVAKQIDSVFPSKKPPQIFLKQYELCQSKKRSKLTWSRQRNESGSKNQMAQKISYRKLSNTEQIKKNHSSSEFKDKILVFKKPYQKSYFKHCQYKKQDQLKVDLIRKTTKLPSLNKNPSTSYCMESINLFAPDKLLEKKKSMNSQKKTEYTSAYSPRLSQKSNSSQMRRTEKKSEIEIGSFLNPKKSVIFASTDKQKCPETPQSKISSTLPIFSRVLQSNSKIVDEKVQRLSCSFSKYLDKINKIAEYSQQIIHIYQDFTQMEELMFLTYKAYFLERKQFLGFLQGRLPAPNLLLKDTKSDFLRLVNQMKDEILPFISDLRQENDRVNGSLRNIYNLMIQKSGSAINLSTDRICFDRIISLMREQVILLKPNLETSKKKINQRLMKIIECAIILSEINAIPIKKQICSHLNSKTNEELWKSINQLLNSI